MRNCWIKLFWLIVIISFWAVPGVSRAEYDYVDISHPFLRKIPMAVQLFKKVSSGHETDQLSESASDLLAETLEFTGFFKLLDRKAFLVDPQTDATFVSVNFHDWTSIGA